MHARVRYLVQRYMYAHITFSTGPVCFETKFGPDAESTLTFRNRCQHVSASTYQEVRCLHRHIGCT